MTKFKALFHLFDTFVAGIWGLTMIEMFTVFYAGGFDMIDDGLKTLLALAGLFYIAAVKIPNEIKMNKLKQREKKAAIEKAELENKDYIKTHE
tara:strand:+ start:932 stop:1210 length:279 start_codon:yes stop_codon:yes gene_type:complete